MRGPGGGVRRYAEELKAVLAYNGHQVFWNHEVSLQDVQHFDIVHVFSSFTPNIRFFNFIIDRIPTVLSPIYDPVQNSRFLIRCNVALGKLPGIYSNHHSRRFMLENADFVFTMSAFEKERLDHDYGISFDSSVLHVPTQERMAISENDRKGVLFIGDLSNKRQNINAVCRIANQVKSNITLVGQRGSPELMQRINDISNVQYLGFVDEETKFSLFKTHKVFVLPAFTAGFGMAAVEASEMGLIVAHTKYGGTSEYIDTNGYEFDPSKDIEIVDCLNSAIHSNAKSCLRVFSRQQVFDECQFGYEKALNRFRMKK